MQTTSRSCLIRHQIYTKSNHLNLINNPIYKHIHNLSKKQSTFTVSNQSRALHLHTSKHIPFASLESTINERIKVSTTLAIPKIPDFQSLEKLPVSTQWGHEITRQIVKRNEHQTWLLLTSMKSPNQLSFLPLIHLTSLTDIAIKKVIELASLDNEWIKSSSGSQSLNCILQIAITLKRNRADLSETTNSFFLFASYIVGRYDLVQSYARNLDPAEDRYERSLPLLLIALIKTKQYSEATKLFNQHESLSRFHFPKICRDGLDGVFNSVIMGARFWKMLGRLFLIKNIDHQSSVECQKVPFILALDFNQRLDVTWKGLICGFYCGIVHSELGKELLDHCQDMQDDILFVSGYISALTLTSNTLTRDIQLDKFYLLLQDSDLSNEKLILAFNSIILSLYEMKEIRMAQVVLKKQASLNQQPSTEVYNKRLQATAKGSTPQHTQLYQKMIASGTLPNRTTYMHMLKSSLNDNSIDYQHYFKNLARLNINLDKEILTTLMKGLIHSGNIDQALHVFETQFEKYDVVPDIVSYGCIIGGLSKAHKCTEAEEMIGVMMEKGFEPNAYTLNPFFRALLQSGGEDQAYSVMRDLNEKVVEVFGRGINGLYIDKEDILEDCNVITITILFQHYVHSRQELKMGHLMDRVEKYGVKIDKALYTSWAAFYVQKGDMDAALDLLHKIQTAGIQFDVSLYTLLTRAYMESGNLVQAISVLNHMAESKIVPDELYYKRFLALMVANANGSRNEEVFETGDAFWNTHFIELLTHMNSNDYHSGVLQGFSKLRSLGLPIPEVLLKSEYDFAKSENDRSISFLATLSIESGICIDEKEMNEIYTILAARREIRGSIDLLECQIKHDSTSASISMLDGLFGNLIDDANKASASLRIQNPNLGTIKHVKGITDSDFQNEPNPLERIITFWLLLTDSTIISNDIITVKVLESVRKFGSKGVFVMKKKLDSIDTNQSKTVEDALASILESIDCHEKRTSVKQLM